MRLSLVILLAILIVVASARYKRGRNGRVGRGVSRGHNGARQSYRQQRPRNVPTYRRPPVRRHSYPKQARSRHPPIRRPRVRQPRPRQPPIRRPRVRQPRPRQPSIRRPRVRQPRYKPRLVRKPKVRQPKVRQNQVRQQRVQRRNVRRLDRQRKMKERQNSQRIAREKRRQARESSRRARRTNQSRKVRTTKRTRKVRTIKRSHSRATKRTIKRVKNGKTKVVTHYKTVRVRKNRRLVKQTSRKLTRRKNTGSRRTRRRTGSRNINRSRSGTRTNRRALRNGRNNTRRSISGNSRSRTRRVLDRSSRRLGKRRSGKNRSGTRKSRRLGARSSLRKVLNRSSRRRLGKRRSGKNRSGTRKSRRLGARSSLRKVLDRSSRRRLGKRRSDKNRSGSRKSRRIRVRSTSRGRRPLRNMTRNSRRNIRRKIRRSTINKTSKSRKRVIRRSKKVRKTRSRSRTTRFIRKLTRRTSRKSKNTTGRVKRKRTSTSRKITRIRRKSKRVRIRKNQGRKGKQRMSRKSRFVGGLRKTRKVVRRFERKVRKVRVSRRKGHGIRKSQRKRVINRNKQNRKVRKMRIRKVRKSSIRKSYTRKFNNCRKLRKNKKKKMRIGKGKNRKSKIRLCFRRIKNKRKSRAKKSRVRKSKNLRSKVRRKRDRKVKNRKPFKDRKRKSRQRVLRRCNKCSKKKNRDRGNKRGNKRDNKRGNKRDNKRGNKRKDSKKSKSCKCGRKKIKDGESFIGKPCKKKWSCVNGRLKGINFKCPLHTKCYQGRCVCKDNNKLYRTTFEGRVQHCKGPKKQCKARGDYLEKGQTKLARGCKTLFECKKGGEVKKTTFSCPPNTKCKRGRCVCVGGAEVTRTTNDGRVEHCGERQCVANGMQMEEGETILSGSCDEIHQCRNGKVTSTAVSCPPNSSCREGACVCNDDAEEERSTYDGLIQYCKVLKCEVDGKVLQEGGMKLSSDCSEIHECLDGLVTGTSYSCGPYSSCNNGRCVCDSGSEKVGDDYDGLVEICEEKICIADGEELEEGTTSLSLDCSQKHVCSQGKVSSTSFNCPANSICEDGQCFCDEGAEEIGQELDGLVQKCEIKKCEVDGKEIQEGAIVLSKDCSQIHECADGEVISDSYTCDELSTCKDGKCVCSEGAKKSSEEYGGLVEICEEKLCIVDDEEIPEGSTILSKDCKKKHACSQSNVDSQDYECPENSECEDGQCLCAEDAVETGTKLDGLVQTCEKRVCKVDNKELTDGAIVLSSDCSQIHECNSGEVTSESYSCDDYSKCENGKCVCKKGTKKVESEYEGLQEVCEPLICKAEGEELEEGSTLLSLDCKKKHVCSQGKVETESFECPENSECEEGQCLCAAGAREIGTEIEGLVQKCEKKVCKVDGKEIKEGSITLSKDCSKINECLDGEVASEDYSCDAYSSCKDGRCVCDEGAKEIASDFEGLVQICEPKICEAEGDQMEEGSIILSADCSKKFSCFKGTVYNKSYTCPANTTCEEGQCLCDEESDEIKTELDGLVQICEKRICKVDGTVVKEGAIVLNKNCSLINECSYGEITSEDYKCDEYSSCKDSRCVCDEGAEEVDNEFDGLVQICEPKICLVEGDQLEEGSTILSLDCKKKYVCTKGTVETGVYDCPENSICEEGQCLCAEGADEIGTEFDGLVQKCEKKICKVDGKEIKEGAIVLSQDCSKIHECSSGEVISEDYKCDDYSKCFNGRCICEKGAKMIDSEFIGLVEICEPKICTIGGDVLEEGSFYLSEDCSIKYSCSEGTLSNETYSCPPHSTCDEGECLCDEGAEVKSTAVDGLVQICEKKICKVESKELEEDAIRLSSDCQKIHECSYGEVTSQRFHCDDFSRCDNGKCVCEEGTEEVDEDFDGLVKICEPKICVVEDEELEDGSVVLSSNCSIKHTCSKGTVTDESYTCPEHTTCSDGFCMCNEGTEETGMNAGGYAQLCEKNQCTVDGKEIEDGSTVLSNDCSKKHVCTQGTAATTDFSCGEHSTCEDEACVCIDGAEEIRTELDGLVQVCEKKQCFVNNKELKEGAVVLSHDCRRIYECTHGDVNSEPFSCSDHSSCKDGKCVCDEGTEKTSDKYDGLVQYCEEKQCIAEEQELEEGSILLSNDCTKKHDCLKGAVTTTLNYACPEHSTCDNGRCICDVGTEKVSEKENGLVEVCKKKECKVDGNVIQEGVIVLSQNCSQIHECIDYEVLSEAYKCDDDSTCKNGRCVCREGATEIGNDFNGLVQYCEKKQCTVDNEVLEEDSIVLSNDCKKKHVCSNGQVTSDDFSCPDHSSCENGECLCDALTEKIGTDLRGLVQLCKKKECKVHGNVIEEGAIVMDQNCGQIHICTGGELSSEDHKCEEFSTCKNGRCVCNEGAEEIAVEFNGLVEICEKKICIVDNDQIEEGSTVLSYNCKKKHLCTLGTVTSEDYSCPDHTTCDNGVCLCNADSKQVRTELGGLVEVCEKKECKVEGKVIEEAAIVLSQDCKKIYECIDSEIIEESFVCDEYSSCISGKCVCNEGAEEIGSDFNGLVKYCEEKQCLVNGEEIQEGSIVLSNDCSKKHVCSKGTVTVTSYFCPPHSSCYDGVCACNEGAEEKSRELDGLVQICEVKQCIVEGNVLTDGAVVLNKDCSRIYECLGYGELASDEFSCDLFSSCKNGRCVCDEGAEEVDSEFDGLVQYCDEKICKVGRNELEEGSIVLSRNCGKKHTCSKGTVTSVEFSCGPHSSCFDGVCLCDDGADVKSTDLDGLVQICEKRQCVVEGNVIEEGTIMLSKNCSQIYECSGNEVFSESFECYEFSSCNNNGQCKCDQGAVETSLEFNGLVHICEQKQCKVNGENIEEGVTILSNDCSYKHTCHNGEVETTNFGCPSHSTCDSGQCLCDYGAEEKETQFDGLLQVCELIECKLNGKTMGEGAVSLNHDCTVIHECLQGVVSNASFTCPDYTRCVDNKCVCNEGYDVTDSELDGLVQYCSDPKCLLDDNTRLEEGSVVLKEQCSRLFECVDGLALDSEFDCPLYSSCNGTHCICNEGHGLIDTDLGGLLQYCAEKQCMLGNNLMEEGSVKLNHDCSVKHTCKEGEVSSNPSYSCPEYTTCHDGYCLCDDGYDATGTEDDGRVEICKEKDTTEQPSCMYNGKELEEGSPVLTDNCLELKECFQGRIVTSEFECPPHSSCKNGRCECVEGTEEIDSYMGLVQICEEKKIQKCMYHGQVLAEGAGVLCDSCVKLHECINGELSVTDFQCPANSACNHKGSCVCESGAKLVKELLGGLVQVCEEPHVTEEPELKSCNINGKEMKDGAVWLKDDCSAMYDCFDGEATELSFRCPIFTSCTGDGRCLCDSGLTATGSQYNGLIEECD